MIIGRGMIAKSFAAFEDSPSVLVFASGVSNSRETRVNEFERERRLLTETLAKNPDKNFIYFGTCSVYDSSLKESPYVLHKLEMEELLRKSGVDYTIYRLTQVVGHSSSPTVINFLTSCIRSGEVFKLWTNGYRDLIDVEHVYQIVAYAISQKYFKNMTVDLGTGNPISVPEIVSHLEVLLGRKGRWEEMPQGSFYKIDNSMIRDVAECLGIAFDQDYVKKLLAKYIVSSSFDR